MTLIILVAIAVAAMVTALAVYCVANARRARLELPADWWTDFERQFRAYAARTRSHGPGI